MVALRFAFVMSMLVMALGECWAEDLKEPTGYSEGAVAKGAVEVDYRLPQGSKTDLRKYISRAGVMLDCKGADVSDADLAQLAHPIFQSVRWVQLERTDVSGEGLSSLEFIRARREGEKELRPAVNWLFLGRTAVGDRAVQSLLSLPLEGLDLSRTEITDHGLETLSKIRTLRYLNLSGTRLTDAGLEMLSENTFLELDISNTVASDAGVLNLDIKHRLILFGTGVSKEAVKALKKRLRNVEIVAEEPVE